MARILAISVSGFFWIPSAGAPAPRGLNAVAYLFQAVRTPLSTMAAWVEAGAF